MPVGAGGPGVVALGGHFLEDIEDVQPTGKTSTDGLTFTAATLPPATGAALAGIVAGPGGMAAVGSGVSDEQPSVGFALYSSDGVTWSEANASDNSFDNGVINEVHANGIRLRRRGLDRGRGLHDADRSVWVSADGHSWRSIGDFGGSFTQYSNSALGANGLVVFTANDEDTGDDQLRAQLNHLRLVHSDQSAGALPQVSFDDKTRQAFGQRLAGSVESRRPPEPHGQESRHEARLDSSAQR